MHVPVLQKEVLEYLGPKPNENFIDCTIGEAGHSLAILEKNGQNGKVLGIDRDLEQIENCKATLRGVCQEASRKIENFRERVILVCDNFANLKEIVEKYNFRSVHPVRSQKVLVKTQRKQTSNGVNGILFDLGMCSWHLEESGRGFSFLRDEPLDMRFSQNQISNIKNQKLTAEKIVNEYSQEEIERVLREYGEEKFAGRITKNIVEIRKIRPIKTTFQLVEIIKKSLPSWYERGRLHPATRTFQALRIAVNDELNNLKKALPQALEILGTTGRLVVISFHSLEDRIVKDFFKEKAKQNLIKILTKKPVRPSEEEINLNPRSRSAKLRAAIKRPLINH